MKAKNFFTSRWFLLIISVLICISLAVIGINAAENMNEEVTVVRAVTHIKKGWIIEKDMLETATLPKKKITPSYLLTPDKLVGQYAIADLYPNDYVQKEKVAEKLPTAEEELLQLDGKHVAISINLKDFARGLSDKIIQGDIVSCIVTSDNTTNIPQALTYVKVITTTMPSGVDKENGGEGDENLATATLSATPYQAMLLAQYDKTAEIHLALVYRGDEKTAEEFLNTQEKSLEDMIQTSITTTQNEEEAYEQNYNDNGKQ